MRKSRLGFAMALLGLLTQIGPARGDLDGSIADIWDSIHISGQKVGHIHTLTDRVDAGGKIVLRTRQETDMTTLRFGSKMTMNIVVDSYETTQGTLYAVDARTKMANVEQRTKGRLGNDGKFQVTVTTPGKQTEQALDWPKGVLGPFAQERSLKDQPLKVGETRTFSTFLPELNKVATRTLVAVKKEKTQLLDDSMAELLLVRETSDAFEVESQLWLDDEGNTVKSSVLLGGLPMTTYRVSRAQALGEPIGSGLDLGERTLVRPNRPIPRAHQTEAVTYRLRFSDEAAAAAIPEATYQKILDRKPEELLVRVGRVTPSGPGGEAKEDLAEFLASNGWIQSDDPRIVSTAREVVGGAADPWEKVVRLERWVDRNMTNRDFSIGFATAGEVIQTRQGDCTEHAVLLAALCRAVGVPARVAMGLVYLEGTGEFGYHMWTEVNVGGRWYAADGTLGQGFVAGGHIKLADGSLKGANALSTFLPIFKVIGKLKIDVEKVEGPNGESS